MLIHIQTPNAHSKIKNKRKKKKRQVTDPVAVVADFDNEIIFPKVPDGGSAAGAG